MSNHGDHRQVMALGDVKVVWVMGWSNFDSPRSKGGINHLIGDDGDIALRQGQTNRFANKLCIALIGWVYSNGSISEHGLWARCRNNHMSRPIG